MAQVSTQIIFGRVSYVVAFQIVLPRFEFFMNLSRFEPRSNHFGRICYVVAFQIRFHYAVSNTLSKLRSDRSDRAVTVVTA